MKNREGAIYNTPLKRTPLYAMHVERRAQLVPFAGDEMPVQYLTDILKEHLWTRAAAGFFDVSHMGQIEVRGKSIKFEAIHVYRGR